MKLKNSQSNNSQKLVAIYWDYENIPQCDITSDLLKFARQRGDVVILNAYSCNWSKKAKNHLEKQGVECIKVKKRVKSNAVDFKLIIDCIDQAKSNPSPNIIIIVSGDCFALMLLDHFKSNKKKKVIIFSERGKDCTELKQQAQEFHSIDQLPDLVKNLSSESYISYEDAVKCLIEAIQTAIKHKKSATMGYLGKLMSNNPNFPNYKNVLSIRKPDGTKFSKFSQFLDKVIQEEMIPKVYQSILLANAR